MRILGVVFILSLWVPVYVAPESFKQTALQVGTLGMIGIGVACFYTARRMTAISIQEILAKNPSPPILYLRSFGDDTDMDKMRLYGIVNTTYERMITDAFDGYGPMVAIGRPGEELASLGAARMYVQDEYWKTIVSDLMSRARAVILRVGETPGLQWELKEAANRLSPQQLILFMPFKINWSRSRQEQYEEFRQWAQQSLPNPLPESMTESCLIYFKDNWEACALSPISEDEVFQDINHPLGGALAKIAGDEMFHSRF